MLRETDAVSKAGGGCLFRRSTLAFAMHATHCNCRVAPRQMTQGQSLVTWQCAAHCICGVQSIGHLNDRHTHPEENKRARFESGVWDRRPFPFVKSDDRGARQGCNHCNFRMFMA